MAYDGAGVIISVIELGFATLSASQAAGELLSGLTVTGYTGSGTGGTNQRTNVAEIVDDMAPAASLAPNLNKRF